MNSVIMEDELLKHIGKRLETTKNEKINSKLKEKINIATNQELKMILEIILKCKQEEGDS